VEGGLEYIQLVQLEISGGFCTLEVWILVVISSSSEIRIYNTLV